MTMQREGPKLCFSMDEHVRPIGGDQTERATFTVDAETREGFPLPNSGALLIASLAHCDEDQLGRARFERWTLVRQRRR
jgi:hypothetical protein